ncbi:MAG: DUF4242 domain-containing protein [Pseudomonadota bacterium]
MALFVIERNFAEQLDMKPEEVKAIEDLNDQIGISWLFSFLSADSKRTYCLYEAKDADQLRKQAEQLGIPADEIIEVSKFDPSAMH